MWKDRQGREEESYQTWDDLPTIGMSIENGWWNPTLNSKREWWGRRKSDTICLMEAEVTTKKLAAINITVLWEKTRCRLVENYRCSSGTAFLRWKEGRILPKAFVNFHHITGVTSKRTVRNRLRTAGTWDSHQSSQYVRRQGLEIIHIHYEWQY